MREVQRFAFFVGAWKPALAAHDQSF